MQRRDAHLNFGKQRLTADLPIAFADRLSFVVDRFLVTDARLVNAHVQIEIALQAMLNHFQMQLAHAADNGLAGLFVFMGAKRGVLPLQHLQNFAQLLAVRRAFRFHRRRNDGFRKLNRLQQSGDFGSHNVSPVIDCRGPITPTMSPACTLSICSSRLVAWMIHSCEMFSFRSLPGFSTRLFCFSEPE